MAEIGQTITYSLLFISLYFEVFLLVSFLLKHFEQKVHTPASFINTEQSPYVAVVVPCFNEAATVIPTIESLLALRYPADRLEIIAVDDGSKDNTHSVLQQFQNDTRVQIISKENGGKHSAMNLALSMTSADLIACLDADSVVDSEALMRIVPVFNNKHVAAVTPGILTKKAETLLQHAQKVEYRLNIFNRFILAALGSAFITPGPFSIFRTSVVRELGGWRHGHSTEDMEMALRIQAAGHLIGNAPAARVYTTTPRTIRILFRQRVRWAYGFLCNAIDYRFMLMNRSYGNLGLMILPIAIISIGSAIYLFLRLLWHGVISFDHAFVRFQLTGALPHPSFDPFYINTSAMLFLACTCVLLVVALISTGSWIGTGSRMPPIGTPLFMLVFCFIAPVWLCTAIVRATFRTGVPWR